MRRLLNDHPSCLEPKDCKARNSDLCAGCRKLQSTRKIEGGRRSAWSRQEHAYRLPETYEEALERIAQLEDALGQRKICPTNLQLTPTQARIVGLLAARGWVRRDSMMMVLYSDRSDKDQPRPDILGKLIFDVRKKLRKAGIKIETAHGDGYYCNTADRKKLQELFREGLNESP